MCGGYNGTQTGTLPKTRARRIFPEGRRDNLGNNPERSGKALGKARDFACRLKKGASSQNRYLPLLRRSSGAHLLFYPTTSTAHRQPVGRVHAGKGPKESHPAVLFPEGRANFRPRAICPERG
uniref:Uncharacterized protein n=1 Tax=Leptospirillum ferriphilum TaxID=178606 RepID=A0A7C3QSU6_9BACT